MTSARRQSAPDAPILVARSTRIDDPGDLTALIPADLPARESTTWLRKGDGMVGWGRAASFSAYGPDRFDEASQWWSQVAGAAVSRADREVPMTGPVAFGSFCFADESSVGGTLVVPSVLVGRRDGVCWMTTVGTPDALPPLPYEPQPAANPAPPVRPREAPGSLTPQQWMEAVAEAVRRIQAGRLDKVVLARDVRVRAQAPIDVRWLMRSLSRSYENTWTFNVDGFVGATPELLVRRERGLATSRVLAGTIRRTGDDEHDLALAAKLARSSKDLEEHEYAVRSVADALQPHLRSLSVPESPFVLHLPNVMHLATDVAGALAHEETSALDLAAALHPTAAVCGTPTATAARTIAELEQMDRGGFAGPVGWMNTAGDGEWGIALRSGEIDTEDASAARLFAGCGIVAGSNPDAELAESNAKLLPMRGALGLA